MMRNRRAMVLASIAMMMFSLTGCKKVVHSRVALTNGTTDAVILAVNATAGPYVLTYVGNLVFGQSAGPLTVSALSKAGSAYPITGTATITVGGVTSTVNLPAIAQNFIAGKTNSLTVAGTFPNYTVVNVVTP